MDEEFDNFVQRVTEVESLVKQMSSSDKEVAGRAARRADILLGGRALPGDRQLEDLVAGVHCSKDRSVINQRAFDNISDNPGEMSKEAFMTEIGRDADRRAKERRESKQLSDELKKEGIVAFRSQKFEKALDLFSKAIGEVRDSAVLYENRALTCLHLELYSRAIEDCNWALRLNANSLKALLYKSRALHHLEEKEKSRDCIEEAIRKHPQHENLIKEYKNMWMEQSAMNLK